MYGLFHDFRWQLDCLKAISHEQFGTGKAVGILKHWYYSNLQTICIPCHLAIWIAESVVGMYMIFGLLQMSPTVQVYQEALDREARGYPSFIHCLSKQQFLFPLSFCKLIGSLWFILSGWFCLCIVQAHVSCTTCGILLYKVVKDKAPELPRDMQGYSWYRTKHGLQRLRCPPIIQAVQTRGCYLLPISSRWGQAAISTCWCWLWM